MRSLLLLIAVLFAGCDSPVGTAEARRPINVRVVTATGVAHTVDGVRVDVALENTGGPGFYKVEAWGRPTTPAVIPQGSPPPKNAGHTVFVGETEPEISASFWKKSRQLDFANAPNGSSASYLVVMGRDSKSTIWRQTHQFDIP